MRTDVPIRGGDMFGLNMNFDIKFFAGLVSTVKTLPFTSIKTGHMGLHCIWKEGRNTKLRISVSMKLCQVIFQSNSIRQCAGAVGTDIFGGCHVLGLHVTLNIEFLAGQISAAKTLPLPSSINPDHQGLKTF